MKIFKFLLVTVTNFLFFFSQSALAEYGIDDVPDDKGEKTKSIGAEVEINEFILLRTIPPMELYYYPFSASKADIGAGDDVPGGAGSTFVGGGIIKWHANIDTTISIDEFTLTHTDTSLTELNELPGVYLRVNIATSNEAVDPEVFDMISFDSSVGPELEDMSADMTTAFRLDRNYPKSMDHPSYSFSSGNGWTDFAIKYWMSITLGEAGSVQQAGMYRASATVRAVASVSN